MKRKVLLVMLTLCVLLPVLTACADVPASTTESIQTTANDPTQTTAPVETTETTTAVVEPVYCPWEYDVSAEADGKLHYYFMASGGLEMGEEKTKWGDATLIVFPNGETMLVDTAQTGYTPVLLENLRRMGVEKLDYLLLTHSHSDHINGAVSEGGVFDSVPVGQVYISGVYNGKLNLLNGRIEDPYLVDNICKEKNIPLQILQQGDELTFGDVKLRILWPDKALVNQEIVGTEEVNNASLVLRFSFGDHVSIFPGDIYASAEQELVAAYKDDPELLRAELLKLPHHGHKTSNTLDFAGAVQPKLAVISGYTTLSSTIKTVYEICNAEILTDKRNGYIHVVTDGTNMTWETSQ